MQASDTAPAPPPPPHCLQEAEERTKETKPDYIKDDFFDVISCEALERMNLDGRANDYR